ncbi:hypothetical protein [Sphingorhabdus sp. EL138]|uniref:hypothetical protein n=1 Tax=Sphingorhabdus sp. EL138 TaxID=2073156 RepID=UPI0013A54381|nr:hypothetical protein [Sphingorhabdus sp. EL138]
MILPLAYSIVLASCATLPDENYAWRTIEQCDYSGDEVISEGEALDCGLPRRDFLDMDFNDDGFLTFHELANYG